MNLRFDKYKNLATNTRFPSFSFSAVNFASFIDLAMMYWTARRGWLYSLCRTQNSITGVSIYTLITDMFPRRSRACSCVYGSSSVHIYLAGDTDPLPGSGISFRFNWTSHIAPLPRDINEPHLPDLRAFWLRTVRCVRVFRYSSPVRIDAFTPQVSRISGSSRSRAARMIARHVLRFFHKWIASLRGAELRCSSRDGDFSIINFDGPLNYSCVART